MNLIKDYDLLAKHICVKANLKREVTNQKLKFKCDNKTCKGKLLSPISILELGIIMCDCYIANNSDYSNWDCELYDYQNEIAAKMSNILQQNKRCYLYLDTGLGKTCITAKVLKANNYSNIIIICTKQINKKWMDVLSKLNLSASIYSYYDLSHGNKFIYEYKKLSNGIVIFDEYQKLPDYNKLLSKDLFNNDLDYLFISANSNEFKVSFIDNILYFYNLNTVNDITNHYKLDKVAIVESFLDYYNDYIFANDLQYSKIEIVQIMKSLRYRLYFNPIYNEKQFNKCIPKYLHFTHMQVFKNFIIRKQFSHLFLTRQFNFDNIKVTYTKIKANIIFDMTNINNRIQYESYLIPHMVNDFKKIHAKNKFCKYVFTIEFNENKKLLAKQLHDYNINIINNNDYNLLSVFNNENTLNIICLNPKLLSGIDLDDKIGNRRRIVFSALMSNKQSIQVIGRFARINSKSFPKIIMYGIAERFDIYHNCIIRSIQINNSKIKSVKLINNAKIKPIEKKSFNTSKKYRPYLHPFINVSCIEDYFDITDYIKTLDQYVPIKYISANNYLDLPISSELGIYIDYVIRHIIHCKANIDFADSRSDQINAYPDDYEICKQSKNTKEVLKNLFKISLNHLLYFHENISNINYVDITNLYDSLNNWCIELLANKNNVLINPCVGNTDYKILGDCDIIVDDRLIDIKCSRNYDYGYFEQLVIYASLYKINTGIKINTLTIYNPILNFEANLSIVNWHCELELLNYIKNKMPLR